MSVFLASTTSHKREPLLATLEVFGRLGLRDVDLNLHHVLEASAFFLPLAIQQRLRAMVRR